MMAANRPGYGRAYSRAQRLLSAFGEAAAHFRMMREDRDEAGGPKGWRVAQSLDKLAAVAEQLAKFVERKERADG
jgi:hypothetical protein